MKWSGRRWPSTISAASARICRTRRCDRWCCATVSKRNEDNLALLKRVTAATLRAMAGRPDVGISYGAGEGDLRGNRVRLPNPAPRPVAHDVARLRGTADAAALLLRYHDVALHRRRMPA